MSYNPGQLFELIHRQLPHLDEAMIKQDLQETVRLIGGDPNAASITEEQWTKATLMVEMVRNQQAPDFATAVAIIDGAIEQVPMVAPGQDPLTQLVQATRDQVYPVVQPVAKGVVNSALTDFAAAYRPVVEQTIADAVADMPPIEIDVAEIVRGKSGSGGGIFSRAAQRMLEQRNASNRALPQSEPSEETPEQ